MYYKLRGHGFLEQKGVVHKREEKVKASSMASRHSSKEKPMNRSIR
jgi:hypothetical protein